MRKFMIVSLVLVVSIAVGLVGCIGFSGPNSLRWSVARHTGLHLHQDIGVNVGPLLLGTVCLLGGAEAAPLRGLTSVQVGVYTISKGSDAEAHLDEFTLPGWETFVKIREDSMSGVILVKSKGDRITGMAVVIQEDDELIIARLNGRLDKVLAESVKYANQDGEGWGDFMKSTAKGPL